MQPRECWQGVMGDRASGGRGTPWVVLSQPGEGGSLPPVGPPVAGEGLTGSGHLHHGHREKTLRQGMPGHRLDDWHTHQIRAPAKFNKQPRHTMPARV